METADWHRLRPRVTQRLLAGIVDRLVESFRPHKIILFGSHAYGKPGPDSDLDLFVIMDSDEPRFPRMSRVAAVAEVPFLPMDVIVRTPMEVAERVNMGDTFMADILARGKVLYERAGGMD